MGGVTLRHGPERYLDPSDIVLNTAQLSGNMLENIHFYLQPLTMLDDVPRTSKLVRYRRKHAYLSAESGFVSLTVPALLCIGEA
jgi:hypothetical protein